MGLGPASRAWFLVAVRLSLRPEVRETIAVSMRALRELIAQTALIPSVAFSLATLVSIGCSRQFDSSVIEKRMADSLAALPALPASNLSGTQAFENYFQFAQTISLSEEVPLGGINDMDVGPDGSLLITDARAREVVLFAGNGDILKRLSAEPCHPGLNWAPLMARFTPTGKILVLFDGQPGFYFSRNGTCIERLDATFWPPRMVGFASDGTILGLYAYPQESYIATMNSSGQELTRFGTSEKFTGITSRVRAGGIVTDKRDIVYVLHPFIPHVYKYDLNGQLVGLLGPKPSYYREIQDDVRISDSTPLVMKAIREKRNAATISGKIFMLSENVLLVLYLNQYKLVTKPDEHIGLMIMDTTGTPLIDEEIQTGSAGRLLFAKHGLAYRRGRAEVEADGSISNPRLDVYRFAPLTQADQYDDQRSQD